MIKHTLTALALLSTPALAQDRVAELGQRVEALERLGVALSRSLETETRAYLSFMGLTGGIHFHCDETQMGHREVWDRAVAIYTEVSGVEPNWQPLRGEFMGSWRIMTGGQAPSCDDYTEVPNWLEEATTDLADKQADISLVFNSIAAAQLEIIEILREEATD